MKPVYSIPKLVKYPDLKKTWYVYFRYNGKLFKRTLDINRIHNYKDRLLAGEGLAKALHLELKNGWNPLVPDEVYKSSAMALFEALDFALDKKKANLSPKSYLDYSGTVKFCKEAIVQLKYSQLLVTDTKRVHIKTILDTVKKSRPKWSNTSYNKHLGYLQSILSELVEWEIIDFNPAHKIKTLKEMKSTANIPPTEEEMKLIKEAILKFDPDFWDFQLMQFHTGARPVEITQIKVKMIDARNRTLILPPDITKTSKERIIPINNHLWAVLEPRIDYPKDYYIFGTNAPHKGYKRCYKGFVPGVNKLKRGTATRLWEKIVKICLGIDKNMYSMKKAGANAKILAGMSMRALKELFGHSSEVTTEIYITKLHEVTRKEIMDKSPSL